METRGELLYFFEKKVFKKLLNDLQDEKILEKFILVLRLDLQDFNPMEKASLTL